MSDRKSIDGRGADLIAHFAKREPAVFDVREAAEFLGIESKPTSSLLSNLVGRGWLVRHYKGVFEVAPLWASAENPFDPDRFAALAHWVPEPYYVGFRSAMEIREWLDHPVRNRLWIAVPRPRQVPRTVRDRVTWVVLREDRFTWGRERRWVGTQVIQVSDPERTVLDCLHLPRHAGGVTEVVAVLLRAWSSLDKTKLVEYTDRLGIESVRRRLGFLLDTVELPGGRHVAMLLAEGASKGRRSPAILDPSLPADGTVDRRWGVLVNVEPSEIAAAGRT